MLRKINIGWLKKKIVNFCHVLFPKRKLSFGFLVGLYVTLVLDLLGIGVVFP
jgi:hypothetical protein